MGMRPSGGAATKVFTVWGNRATSTPANYRQLLAQTLRKTPEIHCTPDTMPDGGAVCDATVMRCFWRRRPADLVARQTWASNGVEAEPFLVHSRVLSRSTKCPR